MKKLFLMLFMATTIFIGCDKDENENPLANTSWSLESIQTFKDGVLVNNYSPEEIECMKKSTISFTDAQANSKNWEYNNNTKGCVSQGEYSDSYTVSGDVITTKGETTQSAKFSINGDELQVVFEGEKNGVKYKAVTIYKRIK